MLWTWLIFETGQLIIVGYHSLVEWGWISLDSVVARWKASSPLRSQLAGWAGCMVYTQRKCATQCSWMRWRCWCIPVSSLRRHRRCQRRLQMWRNQRCPVLGDGMRLVLFVRRPVGLSHKRRRLQLRLGTCAVRAAFSQSAARLLQAWRLRRCQRDRRWRCSSLCWA